MRIISYRIPKEASSNKNTWFAGIEQNGYVIPAEACHEFGTQPPTVRVLLEADPLVLKDVLIKAKQELELGKHHFLLLTELEIGPPVPNPDKIICLGLSYDGRISSIDQLELSGKFQNSLIGPYASVILPSISHMVDYEGELAIVIGRVCKHVNESEALSYIAGYTVINDINARDIQMRGSQWMGGKAIDTFAPTGPGIVPTFEISDPQQLTIITRLNGEVLQHANTNQMIFSVSKIIEMISSLMTLVPGDIIATGTPPGSGFTRQPQIFLHNGDRIEVEIERIGIITNDVVNENTH